MRAEEVNDMLWVGLVSQASTRLKEGWTKEQFMKELNERKGFPKVLKDKFDKEVVWNERGGK